MLLALNKPYGFLSRFTEEAGSQHRPLADLSLPPDVYPVGRLDADSEGLLLLASRDDDITNLLEPHRRHPREYWAQVEGTVTDDALRALEGGLEIQGRTTLPAVARALDDPGFAERDPPVRFRKSVPTSWLSLELIEGKNRQVRRMTAKVGFPTLRLVRVRIGAFALGDIPLGEARPVDDAGRAALYKGARPVRTPRPRDRRRRR